MLEVNESDVIKELQEIMRSTGTTDIKQDRVLNEFLIGILEIKTWVKIWKYYFSFNIEECVSTAKDGSNGKNTTKKNERGLVKMLLIVLINSTWIICSDLSETLPSFHIFSELFSDATHSHFWQPALCCINRYEVPSGMWAESNGKFISVIISPLKVYSSRLFLPIFLP